MSMKQAVHSLIQLTNVSKIYKTPGEDHVALHSLQMSIECTGYTPFGLMMISFPSILAGV